MAFNLRVRAQARRESTARGRLAWCLLCGQGFVDPVPFLAARRAQPNVFPKRNIAFSLLSNPILILFTDLSMAGLPAELKHITQRRKRKQP